MLVVSRWLTVLYGVMAKRVKWPPPSDVGPQTWFHFPRWTIFITSQVLTIDIHFLAMNLWESNGCVIFGHVCLSMFIIASPDCVMLLHQRWRKLEHKSVTMYCITAFNTWYSSPTNPLIQTRAGAVCMSARTRFLLLWGSVLLRLCKWKLVTASTGFQLKAGPALDTDIGTQEDWRKKEWTPAEHGSNTTQTARQLKRITVLFDTVSKLLVNYQLVNCCINTSQHSTNKICICRTRMKFSLNDIDHKPSSSISLCLFYS